MLDRLRLLVLFDELDKELLDCPFTELVIVGGASMAFLAVDRRTKDVDVASDLLPAYLKEAVASVAKRNGLAYWWVNDSAAGNLPTGIPLNLQRVFSGRKLIVETPDERGILAMKIAASREVDKKDAIFLARTTGIISEKNLYALVAEAYPKLHLTSVIAAFISEVSASAIAEDKRALHE